jgi:hypothetical protein
MKPLLWIGALLAVFWVREVSANPFRAPYVCAPRINPSESPLQFRIRETASCGEGEILLKVYEGKDGAVLLYPASPPAPEEAEDLKRFKEFYGITP